MTLERAPTRSLTRRWGALATLAGLLGVIAIGIATGPAPPAAPQRILSVGLALGTGDLGDRAFNDSAYAGLQRAQREMGVRFRVVAWKGGDRQLSNLRDLAQERPDLIIAVGQENAAALTAVAQEYPTQRFAIVDIAVDAPNVTAVTFRELQGDFLAGALAALLSPGGTVGFLGGADVPVIRRIQHGWEQGVRSINPQARILSHYAAGKDDFSGFNKPDTGQQLTATMYQEGAEVVYAAAGRTALGAIMAAQQQGRLVITTGTDQRWIAPQVVVTSRTKNMDQAILRLLADLQAGTLQPGVRVLDLSSGGVGLAPLDGAGLEYGAPTLVPPEVRERIEAIQRDLAEGKIVVTEYQP
jgi:basic membrane protein A